MDTRVIVSPIPHNLTDTYTILLNKAKFDDNRSDLTRQGNSAWNLLRRNARTGMNHSD